MISKHDLGIKNNNGEGFTDLCGNFNLTIGGTIFSHKGCHILDIAKLQNIYSYRTIFYRQKM